MMGEESRFLAKPFETLCQQSILLTLLACSVTFSLWNAELLDPQKSKTEVYIACECSIVICMLWLLAGGLVLRKA